MSTKAKDSWIGIGEQIQSLRRIVNILKDDYGYTNFDASKIHAGLNELAKAVSAVAGPTRFEGENYDNIDIDTSHGVSPAILDGVRDKFMSAMRDIGLRKKGDEESWKFYHPDSDISEMPEGYKESDEP